MAIIKNTSFPRILISAVNGGSGKTYVTTGILAAFTARCYKTQAFKKGPDYLDPKWHSLASQRPCYNLDMHLFEDQVMRHFSEKAKDADISVIEGNHGLYDSIDMEGKGSSAYLARYLQSPVILIVNCKMMSRSVAALINGFAGFEKNTNIAGIILNHVSGKRHEERLKEAIKFYCSVPVVGVIHKSENNLLQERHIGLISTEENKKAAQIITELQNIMEQSIDLEKILQIANSAPPLETHSYPKKAQKSKIVSLGVARDIAFNFYYHDNLDELERQGAELIYFSPTDDKKLPEMDGLYIGGGYPEIYALELEQNISMRGLIKKAIENGLPVFAECGGMMYLTENIHWNGQTYEMVGALPCSCKMSNKPQGRGYVELESRLLPPEIITLWNLKAGTITRAHEFHYSILENLPDNSPFIFSMMRGTGITGNHDGIIYKNILATYTHVHCLAAPWWSKTFVNAAKEYKQSQGR